MRSSLARMPLQWKIVVSTSVAITALFAVTGWIAVNSAARATAVSINHEARASLQAYRSIWQARADRLASATAILSAMSDVRAAFSTRDDATIRDTAAELWSRVSDEDALFLVTDPHGRVIASLGGASLEPAVDVFPAVEMAASRFPAQISGFLPKGAALLHITMTPVYVQAAGGESLLNVLVAGYAINAPLATRLKEATGGSDFLFLSGGRVIATTLPQAEAAAVAQQLTPSSATVRAGEAEYAPLETALAGLDGAPVGSLVILRSYAAAKQQIAALRRGISLLWLASLLAGLALTWLTARRIVDPVKKLDRAAALVAARNYDCTVEVTSEDELGRLASTFNAMCASIREAREELIRSERIGVVGRLAASIVHDLRNPLAAIYGGAEMLRDGRLSVAQTQRLARNIYDSSRRIQQMLQDLLDLGRAGVCQREPVEVRDLVSRAADSLALRAEALSIAITANVPDGLRAELDARRMERVLANLIGNAMEAMPTGGEINISAGRQGDAIVVTVRDNGPGIPEEIREKLFQPFFASGKRNGLGLGLALSRQAVVDHGGDLWAERSTSGACFVFRVPLGRAA